MSELANPNDLKLSDERRSAKKSMGFLLFIIFQNLLQLYRLEFQIHANQFDAVPKAKKVLFLSLGIQTIMSMLCLDFFYKHKIYIDKNYKYNNSIIGYRCYHYFRFHSRILIALY